MKKMADCPKHCNQNMAIQKEVRKSGDHTFKVKCLICGKLGPRRNTMHGARKAWDILIGDQGGQP
jgi:hypothetical protein